MPTVTADRRVLTDDEKARVRQQFRNTCYLCETTLEGYDASEIEYDHIYAYAEGYSQELANFAPVHASLAPEKKSCHKAKGRKSPYEYKEELRIREAMSGVTGLKDVCPSALPVDVSVDPASSTVRLNGHASA